MPSVRVLAAGSLKAAFGDLARTFPQPLALVFGPSGTLRTRIEAGETAHLFASADLAHPARLVSAGRGDRVRPFAGSRLCLLARAEVAALDADPLALLLDPGVRIGMSTPGEDPSADYVLELFAAVDRHRPGVGAALASRARRLTGSSNHASAPGDLNQYAWLLALNRADLFVTYRTNAFAARRDLPELRLIELPPELAIEARFGLTVLDPLGEPFARHILGECGRTALARQGFQLPEPS